MLSHSYNAFKNFFYIQLCVHFCYSYTVRTLRNTGFLFLIVMHGRKQYSIGPTTCHTCTHCHPVPSGYFWLMTKYTSPTKKACIVCDKAAGVTIRTLFLLLTLIFPSWLASPTIVYLYLTPVFFLTHISHDHVLVSHTYLLSDSYFPRPCTYISRLLHYDSQEPLSQKHIYRPRYLL